MSVPELKQLADEVRWQAPSHATPSWCSLVLNCASEPKRRQVLDAVSVTGGHLGSWPQLQFGHVPTRSFPEDGGLSP